MNYLRPELLDQLAGSYVLGTLRGPARRRFERLCQTSSVARIAVQEWESKLLALAVSVPPVLPPATLWSRIAHQLGHIEAASSHWKRLFAPALSFAFGLILAVGVLQVFPNLLPQAEKVPPIAVSANTGLPPSYVGLLLDKDGVPAILASSLRHGRTLSIKFLQAVDIPEGKVAAVWALAPDSDPVLLGMLPEGKHNLEMSGTSETLLSKTKQLAVSIEDTHDVTRKPSGNFVFSGHCVKLW